MDSFVDVFNGSIGDRRSNDNYFVKKFSNRGGFKKEVSNYAHEFHTEFPNKFGKVIVISMSNLDKRAGDVVYISPTAVEALEKEIGFAKENLTDIDQIREVFEDGGDFFSIKG